MGTRGYTGFVIDEKELVAYQQYDSYASGVGVQVLQFARDITDIEEVRRQARALVAVDEGAEPNEEQLAQLAGRFHQNVSTKRDWYAHLRETQGNPALILASGFIASVDSASLREADGVWIEYSWILDLDKREFVGYEGNLGGTEKIRASFDALPTDKELLKAFGEGS